MQPEVKPRAVIDAWRNRHAQAAGHERVATALAPPAQFSPCLASAATFLAGRPKKDHDGNHRAPTRLPARQADLGPDRLGTFARAVREE
jgi:hypothetical protein